GLDGDGQRRADRLAELAGDAALLAVRIAAQGVLAAEARAERPRLVGVVQCDLRRGEIPQGQRHARNELAEEKGAQAAVDGAHQAVPGRHVFGMRSKAPSTPAVRTSQNSENGRNTFQPRRMSWS